MSSSSSLTTTLEGRVESRNETGVRINGTWANRSRFKPVELPEAGALVRLGLDSKGYITSLEVLDQPASSAAAPTRDRTITRLAVLKAAAGFLGQMAQVHPEVKSEHVILLAEKWVDWVESPPEEGSTP